MRTTWRYRCCPRGATQRVPSRLQKAPLLQLQRRLEPKDMHTDHKHTDMHAETPAHLTVRSVPLLMQELLPVYVQVLLVVQLHGAIDG